MKKIIIVLLSLVILAGCKPEIIRKWSQPMHSVERNSEISGSFVLGCGSIDQVEYFFAWIERQDGGLFLEKTRRDMSIVYEGDYKPHMERWGHGNDNVCNHTVYKLFVPTGTILREFKL